MYKLVQIYVITVHCFYIYVLKIAIYFLYIKNVIEKINDSSRYVDIADQCKFIFFYIFLLLYIL